jgi:hypothetical protein
MKRHGPCRGCRRDGQVRVWGAHHANLRPDHLTASPPPKQEQATQPPAHRQSSHRVSPWSESTTTACSPHPGRPGLPGRWRRHRSSGQRLGDRRRRQRLLRAVGEVVQHQLAEFPGATPLSSWRHGGRTFAPLSLRPTPDRAGQDGTAGDAKRRPKLSAGRLCMSWAVIGTRWGWVRTCGEPPLRPVKSPALPTQVRILSLPQPP